MAIPRAQAIAGKSFIAFIFLLLVLFFCVITRVIFGVIPNDEVQAGNLHTCTLVGDAGRRGNIPLVCSMAGITMRWGSLFTMD
jgi:hypothetical protein